MTLCPAGLSWEASPTTPTAGIPHPWRRRWNLLPDSPSSRHLPPFPFAHFLGVPCFVTFTHVAFATTRSLGPQLRPSQCSLHLGHSPNFHVNTPLTKTSGAQTGGRKYEAAGRLTTVFVARYRHTCESPCTSAGVSHLLFPSSTYLTGTCRYSPRP